MKKFLVKGILFSMLALTFASCDSDDYEEPWVEPEYVTTGVYILNSGTSKDNLSALSYYNPDTNILTSKVFQNQNDGLILGKTANNMVIYGSKMYILVTNSNKIYITDLKGKLLKYSNNKDAIIEPINTLGQPQEPREGIAYNGKVYVSLYDGYVVQIDTTSMVISKTAKIETEVGLAKPYSEQLTVAKNKIYVANSGYGKGSTVSEIDLNNFTVTKTIKVVQNPANITSDKDGNVYIISFGDYGNIKSALQKYEPSTGELTTLATGIANKMALNKDNDKLFLVSESWDTGSRVVSLRSLDLKTNTVNEKPFVNAPSNVDLSKTYNVTVDPTNGDIYIGASDYSTNGDMYIFSADGTYKTSFGTGGINPMGAYFITGVK